MKSTYFRIESTVYLCLTLFAPASGPVFASAISMPDPHVLSMIAPSELAASGLAARPREAAAYPLYIYESAGARPDRAGISGVAREPAKFLHGSLLAEEKIDLFRYPSWWRGLDLNTQLHNQNLAVLEAGEPPTFFLVATGLALIGAGRRRRQRPEIVIDARFKKSRAFRRTGRAAQVYWATR